MEAVLALEDGSIFKGKAFGAVGQQWGEVVFNTAMTGYQEVLTDSSYCGQIVVMTYPLIGNYGINRDDFESKHSYVRGLVVREDCQRPSNWRVSHTIGEFLSREGIVGIAGIDTRALTRILRNHGTMRGIIDATGADTAALVDQAKASPHLTGQKLVADVATKEAFTVPGNGRRVAMIDLGAKQNIIRCLQHRDCEVVVLPPTASAADILGVNPAAIMVSNGPGDPVDVPEVVDTVKQLVGQKPIFGICLGEQVIALALGGKTYKMKFGHRGANHPVKDLATGRVYITPQNHGFAVQGDSFNPQEVVISHVNVNDGTVEGFRHTHWPIFAVQYHPEASPGPRDSEYLFDTFMEIIAREVKN